MKTVNKLLFILFVSFLISCNNNSNSIPVVDFDADKLAYKLEILDNFSDSIYKTDNHNKCTFLVTKTIYIKGKFYQEGTQHMDKVIDYCKSRRNEIDSNHDVDIVTKISLQKVNDNFVEVFEQHEGITLLYNDLNNQEEDSYAIREGHIKLETGWVKEKDELRICLKIIYDQLGFEGGYKQNILNFVRTGNTWKLLKRERINTMENDINKEKMGYCYDTIFYNCESVFKDSKSIFITSTMMFDLQDPKCY